MKASDKDDAGIDAHVVRRIHDGLTLDAAIRLGRERGVLFGPSGAGKTSLLRLLAGLERPDSGHVRVAGRDHFRAESRCDEPLRARGVGMIFQDDLLFPHLSVAANVAFGLARLPRREAARRVSEVAELCGIAHLLDRRPGTLSGGERQRVGLARALAPRPGLLLCDEPVSALDLDGRFALIDVLRTAQEAEGVPMLSVTHSPAEAMALGDVLFRIEAGRIIDRGPPLDVLARRPDGAEGRLDDVRNLFRGRVAGHARDRREMTVALDDGPTLVVPFENRPEGARVTVAIRADDLLLARGPIAGLSARNIVSGRVARVIPHGGDAEVVVRTGGVEWVASVVGSAVDALGIVEGADVHLILKARGCHVL